MSLVVDEIKSKLNIVDLIGEYVRLQKAGASWKACCPFHNEKTPSFSVSEDKQVWHCFGCGKGGDAFGFVMEIEGLDFREALENLAERTGVTIPEYTKGSEISREKKNKIWEILDLTTKFYKKQLWEGEGKEHSLQYLKDRGLSEEAIKTFDLGYAPKGWRNLLDFLESRNYEKQDILKTGVLVEKKDDASKTENCYDRFRERIIFPIMDIAGKTIGYSARVAPGGDESQAKYVNTPETEIYHKSNVLYGIDKARAEMKKEDWVLLVEGNTDVIAAWQSGIKNTVAVSGTALTSEQLNIIKRYTKNIKMFFDMDEAGQKAARRSAEIAFEKEMDVSIVEIKNGKDAADAVREDVNKFLEAVKRASSAMEYFIFKALEKYDKNNISDKKKIIAELSGLINSFTNKVEREHWVKKIAEKLNVSDSVLFDTFNVLLRGSRTISDKELQSKDADVDTSFQGRKDGIELQIMGFLITDDNVWREAIQKYEQEIKESFSNQKIVDIILNKGKEVNFNFEKLLDKITDEKQKTYLRKLYFENMEKGVEFLTIEDKLKVIDNDFSEIRKKKSKAKIEELFGRMTALAERGGGQEEIIKLRKELEDLSKKS